MGILFLAEITNRFSLKPQFTPDESVSRQYGVYRLYTGARPQDTYWTDLGGAYDSPVTAEAEIRFTDWLFPVASMADLLAVKNSCYAANGYLYVHVPKQTWLYRESEVTMAARQPYLSGPKRADSPSDMVLNGNYAEARLAVPGIGVRLSDVISGITLLGSFNITRFSTMKDTVRVSVGADTSRFNLLDTVNMKIAVNGRKYSNNETWIIKEIDPARDRLVLEAV
jgi:hypothetical protein